ncbi:molybdate transport system substrate-binding protein [Jannaschia pohangensis]|uniref:Molybdate transport system substrate-binding protein n=1 Tax=Jannaschia pohangensis TaxID=390807 RepID=A0A1I3SKP3_9RHOB|nr:molybdate transport system substrate-binding protein [Jannaschia pohangensis]
MRPDPTRRGLLLAGSAALLARPARAAPDALVVMAAASLKPALDEIAATWPDPVALAYGGSGAIARQIAAGAPADVVLLAATDWMDWLVSQGAVEGAARSVAGNRLVMAGTPGGGPVCLSAAAVLARLGTGRLAMGDPMSVPAGRYGQQALETLGIWAALSEHLLMTDNVRAALAYVARGDVPLGLVYASDARGTGVEVAAEIPAPTHAPIVYPAALVRGARPGAADLLAHIAGSQAIFAAHGFAA